MAMNQDQDRADELAKRLGEPPTDEVAKAIVGKTPRRATEAKRNEDRLTDNVGKVQGRQRGDKI